MLKMKYWTPAAASSSTRATSSSGVPMSEVVGSSPVTWRRKSRVAAVSSASAGEDERAEPADGHLGRVAPDRLAVAAQDLDLVGHGGGVAEDVGHVGVAGHQLQRPLLAAAADEDGRPTRLQRRRHVARLVDPVVAAVERRRLLGEHGPADLQRLLQAVEPLAGRREVEAQALVLHVVPGRPDAEDGPSRADDVERRHDLGQVGRVAVGDAGDHGAEPHPRRLRRQGTEQGVGVEHRLTRPAHRGQLVEVVHHPDRVVAGLLRRGRHGDHPVEEDTRGLVGGEVGDLQSEAHAAEPTGVTADGAPGLTSP